MQFFINGDYVYRLEHLRLDLSLLVCKFQCYFWSFRLDRSFIEFSALHWRIRLGVDGWIQEISKFHLAKVFGLRSANVDISSLVVICTRTHVFEHQVLLDDSLIQHILGLYLFLR